MTFPSTDRVTASGTKRYVSRASERWTAQRRFDVLEDIRSGKASLQAIYGIHGIDAGEIELWRLAQRLMGKDGLHSKNLMAIARERRRAA